MDFRAEIERAKRDVVVAQTECERAMMRLKEAMQRLGILTGVYHGLSALDGTDQLPITKAPKSESGTKPPTERQRAPKGEARRRAIAMLNSVAPEGRLKEQLLEMAAAEGKPIAEGTMRRALAELEIQGRAKVVDNLWHAIKRDGAPEKEAAGADQGTPAAFTFTAKQEDDDEAATLDEPLN